MRCVTSTEEKLALLARYEACEPGTKGEFARREGGYSGQLTEWRRAPDAGTLGSKRSGRSREDDRENEKLKKNQQLEHELERSRLALDVVGKAHALLKSLSKSADTEWSSMNCCGRAPSR